MKSLARQRLFALVLVALLVATAGCGSLGFRGGDLDTRDDRLGFEDGYAADDELSVTPDDGLNATERRAVVARTMARVELIRGAEFEERVPVRVVTREQYLANRSDSGSDPTYEAWNNQVWEALLLVGEDTNVSAAFDAVYGSSVTGFYSPSRDEIVLVSDAETPTVDTRTLAHELVHALQDQRFSFGPGTDTQDAGLASDGLVEGDANLVEALYDRRCGEEWDCLDPPARTAGERPADFNRGVFVTIYAPYAEGPAFVNALRQRGGWAAVNDAYDRFPDSTEQVLHPGKYPRDDPTAVTVRDRSDAAWNRFDLDRQTDTVGEASIYAMLWANGEAGEDPYSYEARAAAGWDGDTVVPYTNGTGGGYVWRLAFDSGTDAREFRDAYVRMLRSHGGERVEAGVFVLDEGPFADAFRVVRRDDTVTIVNGPSVDSLDAIHG